MHNGLAYNGGNWKKTTIPRARHVLTGSSAPKGSSLVENLRRTHGRHVAPAPQQPWHV